MAMCDLFWSCSCMLQEVVILIKYYLIRILDVFSYGIPNAYIVAAEAGARLVRGFASLSIGYGFFEMGFYG